MKNFRISVSPEHKRAASNILRYYGDLSDCIFPSSSCSWESDLNHSVWAAWGLSESQIIDGFRTSVRKAFDEAGVTEYSISEL